MPHICSALATPLGALLLCGVALSLSACVDTDDPDEMGYTPYRPDQGETGDDQGRDMAGDLDPDDMPRDMPAAGDQGPLQDMPADLGPEPDQGPRLCQPNNDGLITREEVPLRQGLYATYAVATDVAFDLRGEELGEGMRRWDMSGAFPGDHRVLVEAQDPTGRWFSPDFTSASYITPLSDSSDLLGVFQIDESALRLLGVASPEESFSSTKVTYDPAVETLAFPLMVGKSWSTESDVSGTVNGFFSSYSEDYVSQIDARGELLTPYGTFDVLRVRVELERTAGFLVTTTRTYLFVSECFGTVATVVSEEGEDEVEFGQAAELRRLTR